MENEQLPTQGKIFEDEILAGAKRTAKPTKDVPEPHDHGKDLTRQSPSDLVANSLILRLYDVLMNDNATIFRGTKIAGRLLERPRMERLDMNHQCSEAERQRISKLYADMADGELEGLAADSAALTDVALQALTDELARRHPEKDVADTGAGQEQDSIELADVVSIRQFPDLPEALLAKGALESAGIECFLVDDNMIRMDWFYSNLVGGVKLGVKQEDAEAALDLLEQSIPEEFEVEGVGHYEQPRCPKCQSLDVSFEDINQPVAWISAYLLAPIAIPCRRWVCHSCGQMYLDDEPAATT